MNLFWLIVFSVGIGSIAGFPRLQGTTPELQEEIHVGICTRSEIKSFRMIALENDSYVIAWQCVNETKVTVNGTVYNSDGTKKSSSTLFSKEVAYNYQISPLEGSKWVFITDLLDNSEGTIGRKIYGSNLLRSISNSITYRSSYAVVSSFKEGGYAIITNPGILKIFYANNTQVVPKFKIGPQVDYLHIIGVTELKDGGFTIFWSSDGKEVKGSIINANGTKRGQDFQLDREYNPAIGSLIPLADGGFIFFGQKDTGLFQAFYSNDSKFGPEVKAQPLGKNSGFLKPHEGSVRAMKNFSGVVFNANGTLRFPEFQVFNYSEGESISPSVKTLAKGGFVVVWYGLEDDRLTIFAQMFNNDTSKRGSRLRVNINTLIPKGEQRRPAVESLPDGGFAVVWSTYIINGKSGVYGQIFNSNATRRGEETRISNNADDVPGEPALITLSDGTIIIAWTLNKLEEVCFKYYSCSSFDQMDCLEDEEEDSFKFSVGNKASSSELIRPSLLFCIILTLLFILV